MTRTVLAGFGVVHRQPRAWDGSVTVDAGRLVSLEGWQFSEADQILPGGAFRCSTRQETFWHSPWERDMYPTKNQQRTAAKGLLLRSTAGARATLRTPQGDFQFSPATPPDNADAMARITANTMACHNMCTPVGTTGSAHACAAIRSFVALESDSVEIPHWHDIIQHMELNAEVCKKHLAPGSRFFE